MKEVPSTAELYLDLLKSCLTGLTFPCEYRPALSANNPGTISAVFQKAVNALSLGLYRRVAIDRNARANGKDWPAHAETMVGLARLNMLQNAIATIVSENIPGDLIETGTWRGGAAILMRAALEAYGDRSRTVWVADSFEGLPKPDGRYAQDRGDHHWRLKSVLGVSLDEVKNNFARYGLLDDRVRFLPGWFKDTLPAAPIGRLALMRLDGDMYSSTMDALEVLYPKLAAGGYAVIDDYGALAVCRQAVEDYRKAHNITGEIEQIDWTGVFWRKG